MYNKEREQEILSILKTKNGFVTVKHLCEALFASESSIRRDLKVLEQRGMVKRSYGGAAIVTNFSGIVTFNSRTRHNATEKKEIATKAAALINDGDVVFLDQSSSAFYVANEIINRHTLTVVTNNIEIMMLLSNSGIKVISSGGYLSEENRNCLIGDDAKGTFKNVYADIMFFSVKGITYDGTMWDCSREEVVVRNRMLKNSTKKIMLCDSSKFGVQAPFKQCTVQDVDFLISDGENSKQFACLDAKTILL